MVAAIETQRPAEAIRAIEAAVAREPSAELLEVQLQIAEGAGDRELAARTARRLLGMVPQHPLARQILSETDPGPSTR